MKTAPVVAAPLAFDAEGIPFSERYGDRYHPRQGALAQAAHVFLAGNGLPGRWQGRDRFVMLETGFGLGNNFLAAWNAWRADPQRCARLHFVSIEKHPLTAAHLERAHAQSPLPELAAALVAAWPPLTPNLGLNRSTPLPTSPYRNTAVTCRIISAWVTAGRTSACKQAYGTTTIPSIKNSC